MIKCIFYNKDRNKCFSYLKNYIFLWRKEQSAIKNEEWVTQKVNNHDDTNTTILTTLFSLDDSSFHSVSSTLFKYSNGFVKTFIVVRIRKRVRFIALPLINKNKWSHIQYWYILSIKVWGNQIILSFWFFEFLAGNISMKLQK